MICLATKRVLHSVFFGYREGINFVRKTSDTIIIQEAGSAEVDYMPQQAIQQGVYDWVMRPEEIGRWMSE